MGKKPRRLTSLSNWFIPEGRMSTDVSPFEARMNTNEKIATAGFFRRAWMRLTKRRRASPADRPQ